ncbi:MAG: DUF4176 domain-containing protein [Clostridiaceae bacterium]|nr:DUF4176 domain-containing protein [Clostridiaceae bacterium]
MGQLALDYNECERVKQFINNAINHADSEKSYLNDALNESFGCYASPEDEIRTAISDIETAVSKLQDFLKKFDTFINNVKEYDKNLANGFKNAECINKITNPTTSLEFGNILGIAQTTNTNISDGSGFAESVVEIANIIKGGCYIQDLGNGKWRVVGSQEARAAAGLEVAGSTYRIGSQSFNNAGLNKYLPIGSVVLLKNATKKIMIYGRKQIHAASGKSYDYVACLYPEGNISDEYTYLFNHEDIQKVFFTGFVDETETYYNKELLKIAKQDQNKNEE